MRRSRTIRTRLDHLQAVPELTRGRVRLLLDTRDFAERIVETLVHEMLVSDNQSIEGVLKTEANLSF